jgi:hypothetical protein
MGESAGGDPISTRVQPIPKSRGQSLYGGGRSVAIVEDLSGTRRMEGERREQKFNKPQPSKRGVLGGVEVRNSYDRKETVGGTWGGGALEVD